ncbi:hypothetical protein [Hansschlegelia zhihuaiae]|uniref:Nickel/cobalt efflux system n=2 Tax=Hansschlegelia TaxID=444599 RepID=A0A4Q0MDZ2_9HYPH|nr:hypothetical protein [Hansschlegelia zhihuaiae]RXF71475.1 hypothetical protein EK403_15510 [Hansschlegelia zhihuaiae]
MGSIVERQRWLYGEVVAALNGLATEGLTGTPLLVAAAFGFGLLHAFSPGHGKAVMTARYAGEGGALGAIASTALLILVHATHRAEYSLLTRH